MRDIRCAAQFVKKELYISLKTFKGDFADNLISFLNWIIVFGYCMPSSEKSSLGPLILVGSIASFGLFGTVWRATILAQDIYDKKINTYLILPMPSSYVFIGTALSWAICAAALILPLLPIGIIVLWNQLDFSQISVIKFSIIFIVSHVFYGFFALWVSSFVTNLRNTGWLWCRVVNPLFMFSGFFYSWKEITTFSPWAGYINALNPLLYILEATKASFFGRSPKLAQTCA